MTRTDKFITMKTLTFILLFICGETLIFVKIPIPCEDRLKCGCFRLVTAYKAGQSYTIPYYRPGFKIIEKQKGYYTFSEIGKLFYH